MPQWECLPDTQVGLISDKLKSLVWQHKPAIPSGGDIGGRNSWIPGAYLVKSQPSRHLVSRENGTVLRLCSDLHMYVGTFMFTYINQVTASKHVDSLCRSSQCLVMESKCFRDKRDVMLPSEWVDADFMTCVILSYDLG